MSSARSIGSVGNGCHDKSSISKLALISHWQYKGALLVNTVMIAGVLCGVISG